MYILCFIRLFDLSHDFTLPPTGIGRHTKYQWTETNVVAHVGIPFSKVDLQDI